jgi:glycerol-3-phosphate O-acyltransferase
VDPLLWVAAAAGLTVVGLAGRFWFKKRTFRSLRTIRRDFRGRIHRFQRTRKGRIRQALLDDPEIALAVAEHARLIGEDEEKAWQRVREYVQEIVPQFNLLSYYRLGYTVARLLIPLFYKVSVGYEARAALDAIPRGSAVVYLMNHRSNADYVVVAYVLSGRVALSYAVGEWARVWPLEAVFKSFGSYFVRRRYREALYHKVLERYVQLITRNGVTQGIFLEGGLTRDGRFREPKLGLFDYLIRVKRDAGFTAPMFVIPVAINYDRVLEDRSLLREIQPEADRLTRREQMKEIVSYVVKVSTRFLLRRAKRYGRACVNFGSPVSVDAWLASRPGVLELPREERLGRLKELADLVMARIAAVMPVTAVALVSAALLEQEGTTAPQSGGVVVGAFGGDAEGHRGSPGRRGLAVPPRWTTLNREHWVSVMDDLRFVLRGAGAKVVGDERSSGEILDRALVMLTLRRIVTTEGDAFRVDRSQDLLLRYYANSIAHFFEAKPPS